jgi:hypothetical protein
MSLSQLDLINAALIKLGAYKITALNDGSTEADIAGTLYTPTRDAVLSAYPWSFATRQVVLSTPSSTTPVADYAYAFDLPNDHLRTLSVGSNGSGAGVTYRINGTKIETDEAIIILTYIARVSETSQPPFFDLLLINRLATEFCLPLTENAARSDNFYKIFDRDMSQARGIDAMQDTPKQITSFNLINARG